jgi:hypothetical protein
MFGLAQPRQIVCVAWITWAGIAGKVNHARGKFSVGWR